MNLKEFIRLLFQLARYKTVAQREQFLLISVFEKLLKLPVVYTDQHDLRYVLYPGQNAKVYFQNRGNYEVAETRFCANLIQPGMVIFDVGANIGVYTLLFAKLAGLTGSVHIFEPDIKNYRRLCANIYLNGFEDIVKANRQAVFSKTQMVKLNTFPDSVNAWHSLGNLELPDPWNAGSTIIPTSVQEIQAVSLDDYCHNNNINRIDFLKVDVEGAELDVLQGAADLFRAGKIKHVMFEISLPQIQGMGHNPEELYQFFKEHGYDVYQILTDGSISKMLETKLDLYQNFVAVKNSENQQ
jgi:FkbM family methyltransferase